MMHGDASWTSERLGATLTQGAAQLVLLDCRDSNQYSTSHIRGALHVSIPTIKLRRWIKKGGLDAPVASVIAANSGDGTEQLLERARTDAVVVVYEQNATGNATATEGDGGKTLSSLLLNKLTEEGCRARLLKDGFESFRSQYPDLCIENDDAHQLSRTPTTTILGLSNLTINTAPPSDPVLRLDEAPTNQKEGHIGTTQPTTTYVFPVEVLPNLFLGNCENSADLKCLYKHGIKHVVNVTQDCPNHFEGDNFDIQYLRIPIKDHWSENLSEFFYQAIVFIESARTQQQGVLIHCLAGISRSVTVTLAYLMHSLDLDLNEAFECIRRKRANIAPNFNFMGQLQDFEKTLKSQRSCTCSCPKRNSFYGAQSAAAAPVSEAAARGGGVGGLGVDLPSQSPTESLTVTQPPGRCDCACHSLKSFFMTSPEAEDGSHVTGGSGSVAGSGSSSAFSASASSANVSSSPQFCYDVPPSPL